MISHTRARYGRGLPLRRPGRGRRADSQLAPTAPCQMPTHKAQRRGACLVPLQPQAQAPARTATAGRAGGGIDVLGRVAGRPPLISRALHALSRRSRRRGCVVVIDLDPTLWPACFASSRTHAAVSSVDRPRATTDRAMPTSHPYKGSEREARQGPRVYVRTWSCAALQDCRLGRCFDVVLSVTCACPSSFPYRCVALCFLAAGGAGQGAT
jgi:hypothetical protein